MPNERPTVVRPPTRSRRPIGRWTARIGAVIAVAIVALIGFASPSYAHAVLETTVPATNATVAASPTEVVLNFSAEVKLSQRRIEVFDSEVKRINIGDPVLRQSGKQVVFAVPDLKDGTYTVAWRTVSTDGHPLSGAFTFNVGAPSATNHVGHISSHGATSRAVGIYTGVLRAIGFAAFTVAVGSLLFVAVCVPHLAGRRRPQLLTAVSLFVLGVAAIAQCFGLHPFTNGGSFGDIASFKHFRDSLELDHGKALVIRFVLALVGILLFSRHRLRGKRLLGLALVGTWVAALASTFSFIGHPRSGRWQTLAVALDGVHLVAASAWVGGLFALIVLVLIDSRSTEHHSAAVKFGKIAATSVAVVAASGAIQSIRQMSAISDFWNETYGRLLGFKLIAVGLILLVAARSRWLTKGEDSDPRQLRAMVVTETIGVAIVLSLTSLLVNSPPPQDTKSLRERTPAVTAPVAASLQANGYVFAVKVDPNAAGPTTLTIVATKAGAPADLFELNATLQSTQSQDIPPVVVTLTGSKGSYTSTDLTIPSKGVWKLALRVLTGPIDQFETTTSLTIG